MTTASDEKWMRHALEMAKCAEQAQEVPVGAVIVCNEQIIAESWNQPIQLHDPSAHAEMGVIRKASEAIQNYRLTDCTLYVTLEPCPMCVGAMIHARIKRLVFGAYDPKAGAVKSVFRLIDDPRHNHAVSRSGGVLEQECGAILKAFFQARRL